MAYMSQENKKSKLPRIKAVLAKYGMKGSVAVRHHSTLVVNIKSGRLDLIANTNEAQKERNFGLPEHMRRVAKDSITVNPYWFKEHFTGESLEFLKELFAVCNDGNHDRSDIMTDYHDVGWYVDVHVGSWDKPYQLEAA